MRGQAQGQGPQVSRMQASARDQVVHADPQHQDDGHEIVLEPERQHPVADGLVQRREKQAGVAGLGQYQRAHQYQSLVRSRIATVQQADDDQRDAGEHVAELDGQKRDEEAGNTGLKMVSGTIILAMPGSRIEANGTCVGRPRFNRREERE